MAKALADIRLVSSWRAILKKQGLGEKSEVKAPPLHLLHMVMDEERRRYFCDAIFFKGEKTNLKTSQIFPRQQPALSTQNLSLQW